MDSLTEPVESPKGETTPHTPATGPRELEGTKEWSRESLKYSQLGRKLREICFDPQRQLHEVEHLDQIYWIAYSFLEKYLDQGFGENPQLLESCLELAGIQIGLPDHLLTFGNVYSLLQGLLASYSLTNMALLGDLVKPTSITPGNLSRQTAGDWDSGVSSRVFRSGALAVKISRLDRTRVDRQLVTEILALSSLSTEWVVKLMAVDLRSYFPRIYLELRWGNLHQLLRAVQPQNDYGRTDPARSLTEEERHVTLDKTILAQDIVTAVRYCHSQQVLHLDLKPENFLVHPRENLWRVQLADFGSCVLPGTRAQVPPETQALWYRCPELLFATADQPPTPAMDIWSTGCVLEELRWERVLFPGTDVAHQRLLVEANPSSQSSLCRDPSWRSL